MRKLFLVVMFCFFAQLVIADGAQATSSLVTVPECKTIATFWRLPGTSVGSLWVNDQEIAMYKVEMDQCENDECAGLELFKSLPEGVELGEPTYEVLIPSVEMSVLPTIVISYSGVQNRCYMDYVNEAEYDGVKELIKNVGSIGHGAR